MVYAGKLPHLTAKTMAPTSRLYNALNDFLRQCDIVWQESRHLQTLCWMIIGMIHSQNVHLNGFGVYVVSRAQRAQSHQRRFRRWLSNRRIDVVSAHHALIGQALSQWQQQRLYLSLDTTLVWNCFCIVWVGVVFGKTQPYGNVYLAFAHDKQSDEVWVIVSDEPTNLQTFAQYRLRFCVEESFLDLKSNGFNLEASKLRDQYALSQLCGVIALTMLFLVLQGLQVVASDQRRQVDAHWQRSMSYLTLGWNWIRLAITHQWKIHVFQFLSSLLDPQPAIASQRQQEDAFRREFTVLSRIPAS